jgi:hypothetical protein
MDIDPDILACDQATGPGWQSRTNEVLPRPLIEEAAGKRARIPGRRAAKRQRL